jgi:hypothetical protein
MPKIIKPVAKGDFTAATISVDSQGRVVTAASGSAGSEGFQPTLLASGPASGTFTADANSNRIVIYAASGGGGSGGNHGPSSRPGGQGGSGAFAIYSHPISAPFSKAYAVGGAGNNGSPGPGATNGQPGGGGGTTSLADVFNINGGGGGNGANNNATGNAGSAGTVSNSPVSAVHTVATNDQNNAARYMVPFASGITFPQPASTGFARNQAGDIVIMENKD